MLKKYLITGLLIWIPLAFTIWVLDLIVSSMDRTLLLLPPPWRPESWLGFPLPGAVAFVVGSPGERVASRLGEGFLAVYVPTAPNPTSGYTLLLRPDEVRELDMSVDEALKFVISLGVVGAEVPPRIAQISKGQE